MDKYRLSAGVIGQISLMQSVISQLPDQENMLHFARQGLLDIPGVKDIEYQILNKNIIQDESDESSPDKMEFFIKRQGFIYALLRFQLVEMKKFEPYKPFIENFCNVIAIIFEEQIQRKKKEQLLEDMEELVQERTKDLKDEIRIRIETEGRLKASNQQLQAIEQQLRAANQQLLADKQQLEATEQQLRAANQQLESNNRQLVATEQELRKEKLFSEKIVETANAVIIGLDKNHKIKLFNRGAEKIIGYKKEEVLGKDWFEFLLSNEMREEMNHVWEEAWGLKMYSYVNPILTKSGEEKIISWQNTRMLNSNDPSGDLMISIGEDITERKKIENSYRESQSNLQALLDNRQDSIWSLDRNYNFIVFNKPYADVTSQVLGVQIKKGMNALEIHPKEVNAFWKPKFDAVFQDKFVTFEFSHMMDGKENFFEVFMNPIKTGSEVTGVSCLSMDITERKEAEIDLKRSEERFRALVRQSSEGISIANENGDVVEWNHSLEFITGIDSSEVLGEKIWDVQYRLIDKKNQTDQQFRKFKKTLQEALKTGEMPFQGKLMTRAYIRPDGSEVHIQGSVFSIKTHRGFMLGSISRDVTEITKAENNLKLSEQRYRELFNNMTLSSVVIELLMDSNDHIYDFIYRDSNPAFSQTIGMQDSEFRGKKASEFSDADVIVPFWIEKCKEVIQTKKPISTSYHSDRLNKDFNVKIYGLSSSKFALLFDDVTEQKRAEEELVKAKEKAEESDRLKTAFLANMSHEIRTPMNGILGFTNLLKEPHLTGEEKAQYIDVIEKSGSRMLDTINDIIDISKIEAGQVQLENMDFSVNQLLKELYNFFYLEADRDGLRLIYEPKLSEREAQIYTDLNKLQGILTNLLKNAIKFTKTGSIKLDCLIKSVGEKQVLEFHVKDSGIGIPHDRIQAIFNRFEQADIEDTRVFEGSGLGLAIAKSYVEMLGGRIWVVSKEGQGSTFSFNIPYEQKTLSQGANSELKTMNEPLRMDALTVLMAEDDETSILLFETIFGDVFRKIIVARSGKEALAKLEENPAIDIILMDIKMPEMNGYNATREIRKWNSNIIIIAQTAFALKGDREKALHAGCDDYITKPFKKEALLEVIKRCLIEK